MIWPWSFRAEYERRVREALARPVTPGVLTEADLTPLPDPVRRYVRLTGSVGQPRVSSFRATFAGRIRGGPEAPWMAFTGEQVNTVSPPSRFFFMDAVMKGLPVKVFHAFENGAATMRVRLFGLVPVMTAQGPEMTRAETVTVLNDLCVIAPGALVDPAIRWRAVDARHAGAAFTLGSNAIEAVLEFNDRGELVDFVSDDRLAGSADGRTFTPMRWTTPLGAYRSFGPRTLTGSGAGRWHPATGEAYDYIQMTFTDIRCNEAAR